MALPADRQRGSHRTGGRRSARLKIVDPWFFLTWKRCWGRPPLVIVLGNWVLFGSVGLILLILAAWLFPGLVIKPMSPAERCLAVAISLAFAWAIWWNFRRLWRIARYYQSFGWSQAAQESFDTRLRDAKSSEELGFGSRRYRRTLRECLAALRQHYRVKGLTAKGMKQAQALVNRLWRSDPTRRPALLEAYQLHRGKEKCLYAIFHYVTPGSPASSDRLVVSQLALTRLTRDVGELTLRPRERFNLLGRVLGQGPRITALPAVRAGNYRLIASDDPRTPKDAVHILSDIVCGRDGLTVHLNGRTALVMKDAPLGAESALEIAVIGFRLHEQTW
jgi:hypothetical protein